MFRCVSRRNSIPPHPDPLPPGERELQGAKMRIVRSVISSVIEGAIKLFSGSGLVGETFTEREFFQHFGFTSIPPAGSEGIVFVIGNRVFMLASDNRDLRPAIQDGEACFYIDKNNWIKIKADKTIQVKSENKVVVEAPAIELGAASGHKALVWEDFLTLFNSHTHPDPVSGVTGPPNEQAGSTHKTTNVKAT